MKSKWKVRSGDAPEPTFEYIEEEDENEEEDKLDKKFADILENGNLDKYVYTKYPEQFCTNKHEIVKDNYRCLGHFDHAAACP